MKNGADLDRELEALGRMICPEPRQEARRLVERRRRRRFRLISPPFLSQQHLRRLSPVLAAVAAVMLIGGPLALNLVGNHAGSDPLAHLLAPLGREADANDHGDLFAHLPPGVAPPSGEFRPGGEPWASGGASGSHGAGSHGGGGGGVHPLPTPSPSPSGPIPDCIASNSTLTVTVDQTSPQPGEQVSIYLHLHNDSSSPCYYWSSPCRLYVQVVDSTGKLVYDTRNGDNAHCAPDIEVETVQQLSAGATVNVQRFWDQSTCSVSAPAGPCPQPNPAPAGAYQVVGHQYDPQAGDRRSANTRTISLT